MQAAASHHLVVVPHTHWDREWYLSREEFRVRLVALMDGLLELLEGDPAFRRFTLDGQTVVLDDYLEVRPEARERIEKLVRAGRLLVGPWFVLPDEWLVSGEALIRNLRLGLARAAGFGGSMRLGYVPDQFGHVGQLPQVFAGFGMDGACLWRGVGADVGETLFQWEAPDGTRLLTLYLIQGYGNAAQLPLEPEALAERLRAAVAGLAPHSRIPSLLLMNGSDHLEPQPGLPAALEAAAERLGVSVEIGTLPDFLARARREASGELPLHRGELRSGLRSPLLEGCASARLPQKRADFENDRELTRYLEPLSAWLAALGGDPDPGLLDLAWRIALENHPHDSICGCSIDAVHDEMDARFARVGQLARARLARVTAELSARLAVPRRGFGRGAGQSLLAWNPHASGRGEVVGEVEMEAPGRGRRLSLHLRRADGRRVPASAEWVAAEAVLADYQLPASVVATLVRGFPQEFMGLVPRALQLRSDADPAEASIWLGSQPDPGFDFAAAREGLARRLMELGSRPVRYRAVRLSRLRLRCVDDLPGHGLRAYRVARGVAKGGSPDGELRRGREWDRGVFIENAAWRIEADASGRVRCHHLASGACIEDAVRLVSEGDRGDEYTFDPVPDAGVVERPERVKVRLLPAQQAEAALEIRAAYRIPEGLASGRSARSQRRVLLPARLVLRLLPGLDRVDVDVEWTNTARDHRLRIHLRAPFRADAFEVESAFEVVQRPIAPAPDAFGPRPAERPVGAVPQRAFATLLGQRRGFSVANRGSTEVEAWPEADGGTSLAVTLARAVGWLSRHDLAMRPGHAGPPLETPGAQVQGTQRAELCFRLHAAGDPTRSLEAHRFASPARLFAGAAERGPAADGARLLEVDDPEVQVSAIEPRAGAVLARLVNLSSSPRRVRLAWCASQRSRIVPVDLAERTLLEPAASAEAGPELHLELRPWQIANLRIEL